MSSKMLALYDGWVYKINRFQNVYFDEYFSGFYSTFRRTEVQVQFVLLDICIYGSLQFHSNIYKCKFYNISLDLLRLLKCLIRIRIC